MVDFDERRRAVQKFEMGNVQYIAHKRRAFESMAIGEIAWFALSHEYTNKLYHNPKVLSKFHELDKIGELVYIRLEVDSVRRQPVFADKKSFEGRVAWFEKCREIGKELMDEAEFNNAKDVYGKCRGEFDGIPRKIKEAMTDEQRQQSKEILFKLNCNLSLCHLKRNAAKDAIKFAKFAVEIDPQESKAHYRLYKALRLNNDLDAAKLSLREALNHDANNMEIRREYRELCDTKS